MNLLLTGPTTDREFCSLRTRGETRALHLWQLIHDARQSVQRMTIRTLKEMLLVIHCMIFIIELVVALTKHKTQSTFAM